jgi:hypothetical protein
MLLLYPDSATPCQEILRSGFPDGARIQPTGEVPKQVPKVIAGIVYDNERHEDTMTR